MTPRKATKADWRAPDMEAEIMKIARNRRDELRLRRANIQALLLLIRASVVRA